MRRYEQVSGAFFCLVAAVQLTRLVLRWPVQVRRCGRPTLGLGPCLARHVSPRDLGFSRRTGRRLTPQ